MKIKCYMWIDSYNLNLMEFSSKKEFIDARNNFIVMYGLSYMNESKISINDIIKNKYEKDFIKWLKLWNISQWFQLLHY